MHQCTNAVSEPTARLTTQARPPATPTLSLSPTLTLTLTLTLTPTLTLTLGPPAGHTDLWIDSVDPRAEPKAVLFIGGHLFRPSPSLDAAELRRRRALFYHYPTPTRTPTPYP